MAPTLKKLEGHIIFGLCIHACMHPSITLFFFIILLTMHARVLKFHIWIPYGKLANPYFFFSELCPFLELCPFE